jgi:hypothetical protein
MSPAALEYLRRVSRDSCARLDGEYTGCGRWRLRVRSRNYGASTLILTPSWSEYVAAVRAARGVLHGQLGLFEAAAA